MDSKKFHAAKVLYSLMIISLFSLVQIAQADITSNLVAHWEFDDGSGNTAVDSAGGHTGTLNGDPSWETGIIGGALAFDGVGDYVEVIGYKGITGEQSRTCAAWIKADTADVYESEGVFSWGQYNASGESWTLYLQRDNLYGTPGALDMTVEDGRKVGNTDLRDGMWHHIAVVLNNDGSPDISDLKLYVDGVEETYSYIDNHSINTASLYNVMIGVDQWGGTPGPSFFNGLIDDFRIYDRSLTDTDIAELHQVPEPCSVSLFIVGFTLIMKRRA